jgi:dTDP-6-deoxy-L-talose 4-dehydrogenase (NAD+)
MASRVAVTGASGFVGRHVVEALRGLGATVVATSRDLARLDFLPGDVERVEVDIGRPEGVFDRLGHPDAVVHLAWNGLPNYGALRHFEEELPQQYVFLRGLVTDGATSLLVTGTCLEYGLQSGALSENFAPAPRTAYALAKHTLHRQLELLQEQSPFSLTWGRLFYLYGEGQAPTSLWSQFRAAVARGEAEFKMSAGEQLRDFLPISKAAGHLSRLAFHHRGAGTVNICAGVPTSVRSLVEGWIADDNARINLNLGHYAYPSYEPMAFWGNADKLKATIGIE